MIKYLDKNTDHYQVNYIQTQQKSIKVKDNNIDSFDQGKKELCIIKVWINGKQGFAYSNALNKKTITQAIKIAKINKKKEYFYGLPTKQKYQKPEFDKKISNLTINNLIKYSKQLIKESKSNITKLNQLKISANTINTQIINSNGINCKDKSTELSLSLLITARKNNKVSTYWDSKEEKFLFNINGLGEHTKNKAIEFLNEKQLKTKPKIIIFKPEPLSELLMYGLISNFNGKNAEKHKSLFSDKLGKMICNKNISLFDNGILKKGISSAKTDYEGTPMKNTCLIKNGILNNFIYDHNTAIHNNTKSTGNATEDSIGFTNIMLEAPYSKVKEALIVESIIGAHTCNSLTTDFSVKMEQGYHYKNNQKTPVKGVMLSGKVINILNNIISMDKRIIQKNGVYAGSIACSGVNII